ARSRRRLAFDRARRDRRRAAASVPRAALPGEDAVRFLARLVEASPVPSWLGRRHRRHRTHGAARLFTIPPGRFVTLKTREGTLRVRALSPPAPLGAFSLDTAAGSIRAALVHVPKRKSRQLAHARRGERAAVPHAATTGSRVELPRLAFLALATRRPSKRSEPPWPPA